MPWPTQSRERRGVPKATAARIRRRDRTRCHVCGHAGAREIDHVVSWQLWVDEGRPGDPDAEENLACIHGGACSTCGRWCHDDKSRLEAAAAASRKRARLRLPAREHPALR